MQTKLQNKKLAMARNPAMESKVGGKNIRKNFPLHRSATFLLFDVAPILYLASVSEFFVQDYNTESPSCIVAANDV
jgi:hypothetical protein